jgi:hypothetical protein
MLRPIQLIVYIPGDMTFAKLLDIEQRLVGEGCRVSLHWAGKPGVRKCGKAGGTPTPHLCNHVSVVNYTDVSWCEACGAISPRGGPYTAWKRPAPLGEGNSRAKS